MRIVVLQHPQEARNQKNTARLVSLALSNCIHKVGLSWPSLSRILGEPVVASEWGVLFLGTQKSLSKKGKNFITLNPKKRSPIPLKGIIVLDGNWKQSKTLWWRNPWLLKLNRVALESDQSSLYGTVRKQPRLQCLSTLEAITEVLRSLDGREEMIQSMEKMNQRFVERLATQIA